MPEPTTDEPHAYFVPLGAGRYRATTHTGGAWTESEQHVSPAFGLVVHEIERFVAGRAGDDLVLARLTFEVLGVLPIEEVEVCVETVRGGRSLELLEATVLSRGRAAVRARAWRLARHDTSAVEGGAGPSLPARDVLERTVYSHLWGGGYIASLDVRPVEPAIPGRVAAWLSTDVPLVHGEPVGDLARWVGLVDTANGLGVRESPREWLFPSIDLSIHLHRPPRGTDVGLEVQVVFGPDGQGVTSAVLHDADGPVGRSEQLLLVRRAHP
ncbi:MAG: thioesterase family protein [Nocardioidaceae bacterium]|nr:thioesterase family protein [Nocardioidaceae bacterium]